MSSILEGIPPPPPPPPLRGEGGGTPREGRSTRKLIVLLSAIAASMALLLTARAWVITPFRIPTSSMEPTLLGDGPGHPGDTIIVNRLAYLFSDPRRWDVIAFSSVAPPDSKGSHVPVNVVKRVVGLPGETIEIEDGEVYAGGKLLEKPPHLRSIRYLRSGIHGTMPVELGPGEYFVLGDNSYLSQDSRRFGPLPRSHIFGRANWIILPWSRRGSIR